jgi:translation elongation factor P/translation initiation factor 5A
MNNKMKELKSALQQNDSNLAYNLAQEIRRVAITTRTCANCSKTTDHHYFRDQESYEESYVSGLCMPCQDLFFRGIDSIESEISFKEAE